MSKPSEAAVLAWSRLIRAHGKAFGEVQNALKSAGLPALEWYDVLLELEHGGVMRPRDLQDKLLIAQYNLSRLLDRMSDAGLIERRPSPEDGRSTLLAITSMGKAARRRMWPVYGRAINDVVGLKLTEEELGVLSSLLGRLCDRPG